ncbi:MAG: hypothetical protein RL557_1070 [archaeon]|jgi:hypothetical protein
MTKEGLIERIFGKNGFLYLWCDSIFVRWFKSISTIVLLILSAVILNYGLKNHWIDQTFGIELLFFIVGVLIGK